MSQKSDPIQTATPAPHPPAQPNNKSEEHASEDKVLYIHVSCAHCKHYHRHIPIEPPKDDSEHRRFGCAACEHPIIGIGRSSTQTTLASEDSIPPATDVGLRLPPKTPCTNRLSRGRTNLSMNGQSTNQLAPLIEKSPIGLPEGYRREEASSSTPMDTSSGSHVKYGSDAKPGILHKVKPHPRNSNRSNKWSVSYAWDRVRSFKVRAKNRFLKRQRGRPISHMEVSNQRTSTSSHARPDVAHVTETKNRESENPDQTMGIESSAKASDALEEPSAEASFSKEERLRQFRRQKTLKKKALTQASCECGKDCHCYPQQHSDPRDRNGTMSPQSRISIDAVPDHLLDRRPLTDPGSETSFGPIQLPSRGLGEQFSSSLDYPAGFSLPNSTDSTRSRDSQALTQIGSDASTFGSGRTMHET